LTDGIYELRARVGNVNYRILYSFTGRQIVLLSQGCTKEKKVPAKEINKAIENLQKYKQNPQAHTYSENIL
jgi:putative component of toxin-antitoxin plasmid stabilization module